MGQNQVQFEVAGDPPVGGGRKASQARERLRTAARQALVEAGLRPFDEPLELKASLPGEDLIGSVQRIANALEGIAFTRRSLIASLRLQRSPAPTGYSISIAPLPPAADPVRHWTASALVVHRGRVLLLLHREKGLWLPPGGHVRPDESPVDAVVREVHEECGLRVELWERLVPSGPGVTQLPTPEALLDIEIAPGHHHLDLVWLARPAAATNPESLTPGREALELRWVGRDELHALGPNLPANVAELALRAMEKAEREAAGW